jgi:hypothetical protein
MLTVTAAGALTPPAPEHVSEYVLLAVKAPVLWLPLAASTPLQPPDAVHESALAEFHVKVELPPTATLMGAAASVTVGTEFTVTVVVASELIPPGPVQVNE